MKVSLCENEDSDLYQFEISGNFFLNCMFFQQIDKQVIKIVFVIAGRRQRALKCELWQETTLSYMVTMWPPHTPVSGIKPLTPDLPAQQANTHIMYRAAVDSPVCKPCSKWRQLFEYISSLKRELLSAYNKPYILFIIQYMRITDSCICFILYKNITNIAIRLYNRLMLCH